MTQQPWQPKTGAAGAFVQKNTNERRKQLKYSISTTSTTATGVVPIKGAQKYPGEPDIYFTREAWVKQCHLVEKCSKEVGWFALVDHDEANNIFTITELVIPCQEVTAAETDIGKEDLADAAMELIEQGKDTSKMYAWFHSHVNMGVSPSGQDEYQVEDFLEDLADQPEVPAFIRGIQNKKGDLKLDVYYVQHGIAYQNVEFYVIHDDDPQWKTDIETEIKNKVTERRYVAPTYPAGVGGSRTPTGKSQASAGAGGFRGGDQRYNSWSYDEEFDDYYGAYAARDGFDTVFDDDDDDDEAFTSFYSRTDGLDNTVDTTDVPHAPKPVIVRHSDYMAMEVVYTSPAQVEVLIDASGALWVNDENGDIYDYDNYTAAYGEVDGDVVSSTKVAVLN